MPTKTVSRGRPKGSGLDDTHHLQLIAARIAENPELKPTTAIKSIGITDPSTIRRLRDKYKKFAADVEVPKSKLAPQHASKSPSPRHALKLQPPQIAPKTAGMVREPRRQKCQAPANAESLGEPASWLTLAMGLGIQATSTTLEIQSAALRQLAFFPPVTMAFQSQLKFSELALKIYNNNKPLSVRAA